MSTNRNALADWATGEADALALLRNGMSAEDAGQLALRLHQGGFLYGAGFMAALVTYGRDAATAAAGVTATTTEA